MDIDPATETARFAGRTIGNYEFQGLVGAGGMGEVYRAHDTRLDRTVAIKVLPRTYSGDEHARQRFVRETQVASRIVHPYVATVFDVVEDGPDLLLVMEYLEGRTLRKVLRDDRPDRARILDIATEIAEALDAIHSAGIVHRDLKPGNVMIAPTGHVKVMDFGVARLVETSVAAESHTLTRDGFQVGTVLYMSPEQVRGRKVDARSDLFALGGLLWEAITGEHPFWRDSVVATATAITTEPPGGGTEPPSLAESGALRDVVLRLLRKEADERYASAAELLDDLRAVARGERPLRTEVIASTQRRRKNMVIATAFVAGAIATALIVAAVVGNPWRDDGAPPGGVVADARPLVVILPFDSRENDDDWSSWMTADLLSAILGDGSSVRTAPIWRVEELLAPLGASAGRNDRIGRIREVLGPRWILAGTVYAEDGDWFASIDVVDGATLASFAPFQVRAPRASELASLIAARIPQLVGAAGTTGTASTEDPVRLLPSDDRALAAYTRARRHDHRLEWNEARSAVDEALKIEPDYLDARILLADVLRKMGYERDSKLAIRVAERTVEDAGLHGTAPQRLELRTVAGRLGDADDAMDAWLELERLYPDAPIVLLGVAGALGRAGRLDGALERVERAIALDPEDGATHLARANLLWRLTRLEEMQVAISEADRLFRRDGIDVGLAEVLEFQALVAFLDDRYELAAELYGDAATSFDRANLPARGAGCLQYRADAFVMLRREAEAQPIYARASETLESMGHYQRAIVVRNSAAALLFREDRIEEAERGFLASLDGARILGAATLELDPLLNLTLILAQTGRAESSVALANEALEITDRLGMPVERCGAEQILGIAKVHARSPREGIDDLERVATDPACGAYEGAMSWAWAAWYRFSHEDPAGARRANGEALKIAQTVYPDADLANFHADRACMYVDLGDLRGAETELHEARSLAGPAETHGRELRTALALAESTVALASGRTSEALRFGDEPPARFGPPSWIRIVRIEAEFARGRYSEVATQARERIADPWTSSSGVARLHVLLARALHQLGDTDAAAEAASQALADAAGLDLPLTEAWSYALLAHAVASPSQARERRDLGRAALERYLDRIPDADRAAVERRAEIEAVAGSLRADPARASALIRTRPAGVIDRAIAEKTETTTGMTPVALLRRH